MKPYPTPLLNGFPKSGNHALLRAVELLGVPGSVNHLTYDDDLIEKHKHIILVKRDPRDIIVSMLRMEKKPVTAGMFITAFRRFQTKSMVEEMAEFEPWLGHMDVYLVKYEDLVRDERIMRGIADYLGVPYVKNAFRDLPGFTPTWNETHSAHRDIWSEAASDVWYSEGGPDLLARWGY